MTKSVTRATLSPPIHVGLKSTDTIPWVQVNTMSHCQYHESMSIPRVLVNSKILSLYDKFMSIPWVLFNTMSPCLPHESLLISRILVRNTEILICEIHFWRKKQKQNYRNTFSAIQKYTLKKYKLKEYRNTNINIKNTNYRNIEIITVKLLNYGWTFELMVHFGIKGELLNYRWTF